MFLFSDELNTGSASDEERKDTVHLQTWLNKPEVKHAFECREVKENGFMCNR